jgi:NADPH:quinone reductase-like Zn-dependent oxidoreductase
MPMMRDSAKVKAGDNVLILGASGSVGLAAVQIARYFGARVTGMCSEEKAPVVRSVGAEEVLDYRKVDLATCPPTFDVILDASGKASFSRSQSALKPGGVFVAVLPSLSLALEALPKLGRKRISFPMTALRSPKAILSDLNLLVDLARSEKIVPVMSRHFSIEETQDAHRFIESRQKMGDVVIRIAQEG